MATMWTRIKHDQTGGTGIIPVDALELHESRGWAAVGEPADSQARLELEAAAALVESSRLAAVHVQAAASAAAEGTVPAVLEAVGDDRAAAVAALAAEKSKPEGDRRTTLVDALTKIADRPDSATSEGN